jgi:eukaryotic-like serine/threonine-protein kinase
MVRRDGIVKVLDFGLAKLTERQPPDSVDSEAPTSFKTDPGTVVGTAVYMSPEQARGLKVDARTDVFSLGVVLYEMVAGCLPFEGSTSSEVLAAILSEKEPQPLARYSREVPAELNRIVSKALRKEREQRYQTIKDLILDLQSLKQQLGFEAKLERSVPPEQRSSRAGAAQAVNESASATAAVSAARATSSAEYIVSEIKRHKTSAGVALAALVIGLALAAYFYFLRSSKAAIDSIAVLPFINASTDPNTEYLSDGITDSLINRFSQLPNLRVMSRDSVFRYKGREAAAQSAGRELRVQAVLTGRVIQHADNLSISVELVDVGDNSHIWGEQYNRKLSDLITLQEQIAKEVSEKLKLRLTGEEQKQLTKRYTENTDAYQLYLKGRYFWNKRTAEEDQKSIEYVNQAIEKDPNFALAFVGLADVYAALPFDSDTPPREAFPKARAAATRALAIDDKLAEAYTSLASVKINYDWDFSGAEADLKRAIALNPNYEIVHQRYARYLSVMGRH